MTDAKKKNNVDRVDLIYSVPTGEIHAGIIFMLCINIVRNIRPYITLNKHKF